MKKSSSLVLFLTVFIDLLGFGMIIPFLPFYAREFGAAGKTAGMVVGVYSLMQFFFAPIWGRLSDRIGRRPVLLISLAGSMTGYAIFAVAHSLAMLFVSRILAGIAAANIGTAQAYIADTTTAENRARGMGMIGAAFGLGFILGPPLGGILSSVSTAHHHFANLYPGLLASGLSATALLVAAFGLPESKDPTLAPRSGPPPQFDPRIWRLVMEQRMLALIFGSLFLIILAFASMETTVTLVGRDRFNFGQMDLAWLFLFMGVIVATIQGGLIGKLARTFGEGSVVAAGALSLALGLALVPSVGQARYLFVVAFFIAIGQGVCYPSLTSLVTKASPREQHGSMLGISSSVGSLSRMVGPVLGGALYDAGGAPAAFYGMAGVVFVALLLALRLRTLPLLEE
jgi:DHA1 family tetracycline resistance protein-like MFS transporter